MQRSLQSTIFNQKAIVFQFAVTRQFVTKRELAFPSEKKRVSRRAIEKRVERDAQYKKEISKLEKKENQITHEKPDKSAKLAEKLTKKTWVRPQPTKVERPIVPEDQKSNYRFHQSPVLKIRDHALQGNTKEAFEIFEKDVKNSQKDRMDIFTYDQLLMACARSGKWNLAYKTYNQLKKRSLTPKITTISHLLNCVSEAKYPTKEDEYRYTREKIAYIISEMEKWNIEPNTQAYNTLLKILANINDITGALKLIKEMKYNPSIECDTTTYTLLMSTVGPHNLTSLFTIWDHLKKDNIPLDLQFYHTVMKYCNYHREYQLTIETAFQINEESSNTWNHFTVSLLCTAYAGLGHSAHAAVLLKYVEDNGIIMDEILWNSLFHLGTMKYWNLKYKSKESPIHSVDSFVSEMEKRLLALLYSGTSAKTLDLLKTEQIEALLLGAINSHLPKHASKYYTLLIARRPNYILADKYKSRYENLIAKLDTVQN